MQVRVDICFRTATPDTQVKFERGHRETEKQKNKEKEDPGKQYGREEKVNPKLTAYQVELAQVEAEIEKLLDTLTGANATLLAYANKKIEELDTRRQTISKAIAELSVETISPQQIKKLSYYLDNWDSIDFDDKRKAADGLISTIKATSDRVQIEWKI